jgi:hypothetical protein
LIVHSAKQAIPQRVVSTKNNIRQNHQKAKSGNKMIDSFLKTANSPGFW